ncbi:unnamed protein product [Pleuronectes platessa]|uniref:Uncharacterized protein n=1 Tax=Pleuronectes platessa TaxID=8262 RepID=A0A9N7TLK6_PLEPL|nr:unnamed protein product [Pleuronectes platessa]
MLKPSSGPPPPTRFGPFVLGRREPSLEGGGVCHSLLISFLLVFFHSPVSAPLCQSATPPHQANSPHLARLSCVMPDFQCVFPGLITCCRPRRSPTCLPRLCPGYYLSLLSSTTSFAYSLLVKLLLGSVATQLTTGPVCQLGNPSAVDLTFSQRHQARSCSDLADDHCEQRLFTLPLFELLKTAVNNKGHYRLVFRLPVLLLGPHHIRDNVLDKR